jgi:hypothetical protein
MSRALGWCLLLGFAWGCGDRHVATAVVDSGTPTFAVMATCAEVRGQAQVRRAGKPYWEVLTEGGTLRDGDWVRTLAESRARVEFIMGGSLELSENAVVVIEMPAVGDVPAGVAVSPRVSIQAGEVQATPADGDDDLPPLLVKTPDGRTSILQATKGAGRTTFRLSASDAGVAFAAVRGEGTVRVGETSLPVSSRAAVIVNTEKPVAVELPDFPASVSPGIDARLLFEDGAKVKLVWAPVDDALGYRVQVARDLSFTSQVKSSDVSDEGSYTLKPETKGLYVWRVATVGHGGVIGEYGFARRIFFEPETPTELLLLPEDGAIVSYAGDLPTVAFTWQAAPQNPPCRLLVTRGSDPQSEPVVNKATDASRMDVATLGAGEYRWGVYVDGKVLKPVFLRPRKLIIKAVPHAVVKTPKSINKWE